MTENFFQTFVLLLLVTDPFGNVPLFISTLAQVKPERRSRVVVRECLIAFFFTIDIHVWRTLFFGSLAVNFNFLAYRWRRHSFPNCFKNGFPQR